MLKKIKDWKMLRMGVIGMSAWLVLLANASASSACMIVWHEPDCPKELLE